MTAQMREPSRRSKTAGVLRAGDFRHYVDHFNAADHEDVINLIPNAQAWEWMTRNVPLFECPDQTIEEIYYYRWWTFRKHIKQTPAGVVLTEFILPVKHAGTYNTISCALGHHLVEGRWLRDSKWLDEYTRFWFRGNDGKPEPKFHQYSSWIAAAALDRYRVNGDRGLLLDLLNDFVADYHLWEQEKQLPDGLFWQYDVRDGMEESISGSRTAQNARPSISSYMYGNAVALAEIAAMAGRDDLVETFTAKASAIKKHVQEGLWDTQEKFFKVRFEDEMLSDAREAIGYIPWCFHLPDEGYEEAWAQLVDSEGFWAPFGITTAEQRHPKFRSHGVGRCEWDGAVWPFATSQTLGALANVLNDYRQSYVTTEHYLQAMQTYARSHHRNGEPYIGEYLDETTGEWLKGDNPRSRYYNHSTFGDLVITGLVGLRPRSDQIVQVSPLLPAGAWDWFCLGEVPYHGRRLAIVWDRTGTKYGVGKGFSVFADGTRLAHADTLTRIEGVLH